MAEHCKAAGQEKAKRWGPMQIVHDPIGSPWQAETDGKGPTPALPAPKASFQRKPPEQLAWSRAESNKQPGLSPTVRLSRWLQW